MNSHVIFQCLVSVIINLSSCSEINYLNSKKKKKTATEIKWPNISEENVDKGKHICKTHNLH